MSVPEIVCQFCHLRQPNAWDCAHCGRPLHERGTAQGLVTAALPELEPTLFEAPALGRVESLDGLELTALVDGAEPAHAAAATLEGLETTLHADAGNVAEDLSVEIEPTRLAEPEAAEEAGPGLCRYCGTPRREGGSIFCARCGMRGAV